MDYIDDFFRDGLVNFGTILDIDKCNDLMKQFYQLRPFTEQYFKENVFLKENEYDESKSHIGTGPHPGRNLTEHVNLDFIENNPIIKKTLSEILGDDYNIMQKIFVMGVPENMIPDWYLHRRKTGYMPLAPFLRPEFYDMTFFSGIDYHQDLIDFTNRVGDFVTLYVYLNDVSSNMSPLHVVPKSHKFGAKDLTKISNDIKFVNNNKLQYTSDEGKSEEFGFKMLTGGVGSVYFWSAYTLHGTMPTPETNTARVSLRYLIERGKSTKGLPIDEFIKKINGPLTLTKSNKDLKEFSTGKAKGSDLLAGSSRS